MVSRRLTRPKIGDKGVCRRCGHTEVVAVRDWTKAGGPRCTRCGGLHDREWVALLEQQAMAPDQGERTPGP